MSVGLVTRPEQLRITSGSSRHCNSQTWRSCSVFRDDDPLLPARIGSLHARQELLQAEGGTMTSSEVAALLGISRRAVDQRRKAGVLIGVPTGRRGYAYPRWPFTPEGAWLPDLRNVLASLDDDDHWTWVIILLRPSARLTGRGAAAL